MIVLNQFEDYSFHAINDNNYIAGTYWWNNNQEWYAFSYYNGSVTFLSDPTSKTNAYAINNSNHILYYSETQGLILWKEGNHIPVGLHRPYELNGLNDQDIVVGHIITGGNNIAAIWDNGSIRCLDSLISPNLGIHLITAYDINNKGEILCLGSDNFCYFLSPASKITKPEEHEIWISGEQDTIKWEILGSPSNIRIDYSTDGGQTYDTISVGYPSDSCKYVWDIPEEIISTKCYILIRNSETNDSLALSKMFRIKPYILTRIDPTTNNFEKYNIDYDKWGFENDSADVWPEWWFERFDYSDIDPFTGLEYPQWIGDDSTFFNAWGYEFPDWPSFVRAFSTAACYRNIVRGIYNILALKKWSSVSRDWKGSCFGIAGTNALAFMYLDQFRGKFTVFPIFQDPKNVVSDSNVIPVVTEIFTHQFGKPSITNDDFSKNKTANQTLRDIKKLLRKTDEIRTISIYNQNGPGAHTILPYKLEKDQSIEHIYYLYVYDNSDSSVTNAKIKFDTTANGNTGKWEPLYAWENWGGNKGIYLEVTSDEYLDYAQLKERNNQGLILASNKIEVLCSKGNDILIKNSMNEQIGHLNGQLINEMPGAFPLRIKNGSETPPYGYRLNDDSYKIETSNFGNSKTSLEIFTGNKIFSVERQGALQSQLDRVFYSVEQGVGISNPQGNSTKRFKFSETISDELQDKMFIVRNLDMEVNDSLNFVNPQDDHLKITNIGSAKEYEIELQFANDQKMQRFLNGSINLPSTSNHILIPDWTDINQIPLIILVDLGNDGTIDDTLEIINQVMGVGEDEGMLIPNEYKLEQNYPNPFNPKTVISYQLPVSGYVTLKVYDLLGREVATLIDEYKPAGEYEVEFNAASLPSGVYFYRLQAADFIQTRKMILLK